MARKRRDNRKQFDRVGHRVDLKERACRDSRFEATGQRAVGKRNVMVVMFAYIQESADWREWRFRTMAERDAELMIEQGEAEEITRKTPNGVALFYKETKPTRASSPSPCTLTMATMQAAAVRQEGYRLTRSEQAHVDKLTIWPFDAERSDKQPAIRAVTVRPRVGERERKAAEALMRRAQGIRATPREFKSKPETRAVHFEAQATA